MSTFNWSDEYSVGNIVIDEQNKYFLKLIEDLMISDGDALITILDDLMVYAETHFDDEEDILECLEYSELETHKEMHKQFITHVGEMIGKLYANTLSAEKVQEELIKWFIEHISTEDAKYKHLLLDEDTSIKDDIFTWRTSYAIGHATIDAQHKKLIEMIKKVRDNTVTLQDITTQLSEFVQYHFDTEESFMEKCHYPEKEEHIMEHRALTVELEELQQKLISHNLERESLYQILQEWTIHHLITADKKLKNICSK